MDSVCSLPLLALFMWKMTHKKWKCQKWQEVNGGFHSAQLLRNPEIQNHMHFRHPHEFSFPFQVQAIDFKCFCLLLWLTYTEI